ncbi:MAG: prepilin-type N-terminal cleavage/methylation domain-containing protein [Nitrospiraceae bacterium]|nr:prepilin-type N-terminal cleavage/methylation domain-containing protein [Nitrospiraceae bacterium]
MKRRSHAGFTLLEILIAMSLSIVILVILFAAMRLGYQSQGRGEEREEVTQKLRIVNDRISWLFRGVYPFTVKRPDLEKLYFEGKSDRVGFVTTSVDSYGKGPEDRAGLKWVSIYADSEGLKIREKVFFLEDVFDDAGGKVYLLDPEVKKIALEYYDVPQGEGKEGEWVSEWNPDDKNYLPDAVKLKMTFVRNGKTETVPEMIVHLNVRNRLNY